MNLRSKTVRTLVLLVAVAATATLAYAFSNARKGYAPRQPILFRHTRMAGAPVWQTNEKGEKVNAGGFGSPASTATRCRTRGAIPPSRQRPSA